MRIALRPAALRDLRRLSDLDRRAIISKLDSFAQDAPNADIQRLSGRSGYRLRIGRWRVLFEREGDLLTVERILDRKDAYRLD